MSIVDNDGKLPFSHLRLYSGLSIIQLVPILHSRVSGIDHHQTTGKYIRPGWFWRRARRKKILVTVPLWITPCTAGELCFLPGIGRAYKVCYQRYKAVFPKLNFSSPKDASWVLPASSPLKCTSPTDIYLLMKSSDFITYDFSIESVFDGCTTDDPPIYEPEFVLRKWHPVDHNREVRCFVRNDILLGA
ncbi:D123-domain-containing protein [Pisolithus microcarpus]|nr:D123-domain-containing protein [Pisolithus microcarpus]